MITTGCGLAESGSFGNPALLGERGQVVASTSLYFVPTALKWIALKSYIYSDIKTFKTYLQAASKVLCVMKKMREDFAITA